jgi:hypothetical protein
VLNSAGDFVDQAFTDQGLDCLLASSKTTANSGKEDDENEESKESSPRETNRNLKQADSESSEWDTSKLKCSILHETIIKFK